MPVLSACVLGAIMHFEGLRLRAYWDRASWAIGFGHHGNVYQGQVISFNRALVWLKQDVARAEAAVERQTADLSLTALERAALVDFVFNLGEASLRDSTLLRKLRRGDMVGAAAEFDRWVLAAGHIAPGLVTRRAVEKSWFQNRSCQEGH